MPVVRAKSLVVEASARDVGASADLFGQLLEPADLAPVALALRVAVAGDTAGALEVALSVDVVDAVLLADEWLAALVVPLALLRTVDASHADTRFDRTVSVFPEALQ